ncbi:GNAT family N-acetyltransferase [Anianabacter salinae]|uniref:GNAT family N-acetyltransferase n=1 Tax=Anianabacter salinae TaxID=2851023 RepID=UPI00225E4250|nr:GNAT family N-acetyltransferase [Anianabacter salinae]MBV0910835.1 GNAT family N-acetyltransferase [Anianabacter salinae]
MILARLRSGTDWTGTLALLHEAFAYMEGRIDPPSSLHRLGPGDLDRQAEAGEVWIIGAVDAPEACMVLTPQEDALYLGKLAVARHRRGCGLARRLVDHAAGRAQVLGLPRLRLQARIELVENHVTFARLGFAETARTAHPGFDRPTSLTMERPV